MAVYLIHHLDANLQPFGALQLGHFANQDLHKKWEQYAEDTPIERYDALRSLIGESHRGDPRELNTPLIVVSPNQEFAQPDNRSYTLFQYVRWAERFDSTLILHRENIPHSVDGVLLCLTGENASKCNELVISTNGEAYSVPDWHQFNSTWICTLLVDHVLYTVEGTGAKRTYTPKLGALRNGELQRFPLSSSQT